MRTGKGIAARSIAGEARRSTLVLTFVLMLPALISLALMLVAVGLFSSTTRHMEQVAALRPMVAGDIPEYIWDAVSGRVSYDACGAEETLRQVNSRLDALISETGGRLELVVTRRTMDTLSGYAEEIRRGLLDGTPIVEIEALLDEIRSVAALAENMLSDCIAQEAEAAGRLTRQIVRTAALFAAAEILLVVFALLFSLRMRKRLERTIREPIERLEKVTGQLASGQMEARAEETDTLELRDLTSSVNRMADRIGELIERNREEQENLKKAELRTLQAQINPHFLYNTLDTILWLAEDENSGEVIRLTKALSDFFRISLSSGRDWITVEQEIRHLSGYLAIQKARYRDVLNYRIEVDEEIYGCTILKLLLQPLAENAIYHGIKEHRGGGTILVRGLCRDGRLHFSVHDTGSGMSGERLAAVHRSLAEGTEMPHGQEFPGHAGSGFGLHNVDQRIRLYYNQPEGLHIESGPEGTTVSFDVPADRKENA